MTSSRARAAQPALSASLLARRLRSLITDFPSAPLAVALSGGGDSVALLLAASLMRRRRGAPLRALHVDHRLQPASARFVEFCTELCAQRKIPLTVLRARVRASRGDSLEAAARDARYRAFAENLLPGESLLAAHHADDQIETVLLQLFRGAGIAGLAAMPEKARCGAGFLVRPLLALPRAALRDFLQFHEQVAMDDPMNADTRFDRNFVRLEILPKLTERWPGIRTAIARSARHAAEAQRLLRAVGEQDLSPTRDGAALDVAALRALDLARRRNALRTFIESAGLTRPDTTRLNELAGPMLAARADASPVVQWRGAIAVREGGRLEIRAARNGEARPRAPAPAPVAWDWSAAPRLIIEQVPGVLAIEADEHGPVDLERLPSRIEIAWRQGGERLRPRRGGPTRTLKSLLQSATLPQADRATLPLLYAEGRLVAAGDRWLDASIQASASSVRRGRLSWTVLVRGHASMC